MSNLSEWIDVLANIERKSVHIVPNASCVICDTVDKYMVRVGNIFLCNSHFNEEFSSDDPPVKEKKRYRELLQIATEKAEEEDRVHEVERESEPEEEDSIFERFADMYFHNFMECMVIGCGGGLYGEEIPENHGVFEADVLKTFIRFQHGDNDYHHNFSNHDDDKLQKNPRELAIWFLTFLHTEWHGKDHYVEVSPDLIENTQESLKKIQRD